MQAAVQGEKNHRVDKRLTSVCILLYFALFFHGLFFYHFFSFLYGNGFHLKAAYIWFWIFFSENFFLDLFIASVFIEVHFWKMKFH